MTDRNTDVGGIPIEEVVIEAKEALRNRQQTRTPDKSWVKVYDHFLREWQIYVMLLPTIIWFIVFMYKPMYGLQIAFKDYSIFRGVQGSPWIGWDHFVTLFDNDQFLRAVRNTIVISFYNLLFGFPAPIILAFMFNEILHASYKRTAQTIVYLPLYLIRDHRRYRDHRLFAHAGRDQYGDRLVGL